MTKRNTLNDPLDPIGYDGLASPITNKGTYDHPEPSNMVVSMPDDSPGLWLRVTQGVIKLVKKL